MLSAIRRHKDRESGFTLIELLVVILIIGILSAIAVPAFMNQRKSASEAALRSDMKNMATEMYTFYAKHPLKDAQPNNSATESGGKGVMGWSVVVRAPGAEFAGDPAPRRLDGNVYLAKMPPISVSDGVAIGVTNLVTSTGTREHGEFCILGNAEGSDYELPSGELPAGTHFNHALFYDSAAGGFYDRNELPKTGGACSSYSTAP